MFAPLPWSLPARTHAPHRPSVNSLQLLLPARPDCICWWYLHRTANRMHCTAPHHASCRRSGPSPEGCSVHGLSHEIRRRVCERADGGATVRNKTTLMRAVAAGRQALWSGPMDRAAHGHLGATLRLQNVRRAWLCGARSLHHTQKQRDQTLVGATATRRHTAAGAVTRRGVQRAIAPCG